MLQFVNEDVGKKYKSSFKGDPEVHLPGKKATGFKTRLSKISLEQADKLFASPGQNLLQLQDAGKMHVAAKKIEDSEEETSS